MGHLPLALSVHHFITSVGADAGFASIVGLAILVLLFFAQARETTTLRDELADAEDRMAQLEARLTAAMRNAQAAPAPAAHQASQPATSGAPAAARPGGVPLRPVTAAAGAAASAAPAAAPGTSSGNAPPGVGAPAQGAATRLIPDATTVQRPATAAAAASAGTASSPAAGGNGTGSSTEAPLAPPPSAAPPPVRSPGSAAPRRPAPSRVAPPRSSSSRGRQIIGGVVALLVVAAIVVVLIVATSGGSSSNSSTQAASSTATSNAPTTHRRKRTSTTSTTPAVVPANVTVAVLNGTATNGLARRVSTKLTGGGYKAGMVTTAADQTHTTTAVAYQPGQKPAALAVAKALGLPSSTVAPIDATTRTVACQGLSTTSCSAQGVVVTVGANLAGVQ
jgi:LytR cell envelope-related transcriptional attenuator